MIIDKEPAMIKIFKFYLFTKYHIPNEMADKIAALMIPKKVERGTILLHQGEICTHVFFVARGCIRSYVTDKKGKTHTLSFAPEEWWIGDQISLYRTEPAMFSMDAVEDSDILLADRMFFEKMPDVYEGFHRKCITHLLYHLRAMEKRLLYLLGAYSDERYLNFMEAYPELAARLPQYMIASYLGISRQSLSRIRSKLAQQ